MPNRTVLCVTKAYYVFNGVLVLVCRRERVFFFLYSRINYWNARTTLLELRGISCLPSFPRIIYCTSSSRKKNRIFCGQMILFMGEPNLPRRASHWVSPLKLKARTGSHFLLLSSSEWADSECTASFEHRSLGCVCGSMRSILVNPTPPLFYYTLL